MDCGSKSSVLAGESVISIGVTGIKVFEIEQLHYCAKKDTIMASRKEAIVSNYLFGNTLGSGEKTDATNETHRDGACFDEYRRM